MNEVQNKIIDDLCPIGFRFATNIQVRTDTMEIGIIPTKNTLMQFIEQLKNLYGDVQLCDAFKDGNIIKMTKVFIKSEIENGLICTRPIYILNGYVISYAIYVKDDENKIQ